MYRKALKVKLLNKVALRHVVRNMLVFRITIKKIHQNFHALKYDIKQPSDAT